MTLCLIVDNMFPNVISRWRTDEFCYYQSLYDCFDIAVSDFTPYLLDFSQSLTACRKDYPVAFQNKFVQVVKPHKTPPQLIKGSVKAKLPLDVCDFLWTASPIPRQITDYSLIYCIFVIQALRYYPIAEKYKIPLICECYPGGGFTKYSQSGHLKQLCHRPYFAKLIVTQAFMRDYIVKHKLCPSEKLHYIYGAPMYVDALPHIYFGKGKETLDICFTAVGTPYKKGFDLFAGLMARMSHLPHVRFHMIGSKSKLTPNQYPVTYHGVITEKRVMAKLYSRMDLIIAPVRLVVGDEHDAFPVGCCIEAGLHGVGVVVTDEFGDNGNEHFFKEDEEIVIVPPVLEEIVKKVQALCQSPTKLQELCLRGQVRFQELYSPAKQLGIRVKILQAHMSSA